MDYNYYIIKRALYKFRNNTQLSIAYEGCNHESYRDAYLHSIVIQYSINDMEKALFTTPIVLTGIIPYDAKIIFDKILELHKQSYFVEAVKYDKEDENIDLIDFETIKQRTHEEYEEVILEWLEYILIQGIKNTFGEYDVNGYLDTHQIFGEHIKDSWKVMSPYNSLLGDKSGFMLFNFAPLYKKLSDYLIDDVATGFDDFPSEYVMLEKIVSIIQDWKYWQEGKCLTILYEFFDSDENDYDWKYDCKIDVCNELQDFSDDIANSFISHFNEIYELCHCIWKNYL